MDGRSGKLRNFRVQVQFEAGADGYGCTRVLEYSTVETRGGGFSQLGYGSRHPTTLSRLFQGDPFV